MPAKPRAGTRRKVLKERPAERYRTAGLEVTAQPVVEIQIRVAGADAVRLVALAALRGVTPEEVVRRALADFFEHATKETDSTDWEALSLSAFSEGWDNPEDAVYDRWREAYGVGAR
ncbi:MAG: hypothetical protein RMK99_01585 [Anaerolineales bacterium]|nr:hypothetical protein [Anaerolineales bacterium]